MLQIQNNEPGQDPLGAVAADFEVCARRAIECLLNRPTLISKVFSTQPTFASRPPLRCFIESRNRDYSVAISLALTKADLQTLFPDEKDETMGLDAVGEVVNILGGCLFGRPNFRVRFGYMRASVPSFGDGGVAGEKPWNVRGVLMVESVKLFLALAVNVNDSGSQA